LRRPLLAAFQVGAIHPGAKAVANEFSFQVVNAGGIGA